MMAGPAMQRNGGAFRGRSGMETALIAEPEIIDRPLRFAMPPKGGIRHAAKPLFIKALRAARPRPSAGWHV
ncbi:MAG: hypothetical protein V1721_02490, partial [Pseudomonadota bacterium]